MGDARHLQLLGDTKKRQLELPEPKRAVEALEPLVIGISYNPLDDIHLFFCNARINGILQLRRTLVKISGVEQYLPIIDGTSVQLRIAKNFVAPVILRVVKQLAAHMNRREDQVYLSPGFSHDSELISLIKFAQEVRFKGASLQYPPR